MKASIDVWSRNSTGEFVGELSIQAVDGVKQEVQNFMEENGNHYV